MDAAWKHQSMWSRSTQIDFTPVIGMGKILSRDEYGSSVVYVVVTLCNAEVMSGFNLSATVNILRLAFNPQLCMPHLVIPTFNQLPVPLSIPNKPEVKAIVLDKDNCFALAHDDKVWPDYEKKWESLKSSYPNAQLLIVSNSAGTNDDKNNHQQAQILERRTGVPVLRHSTKKPGCHEEIMQYFRKNKICDKPSEVAVVGDRLFTDMIMANMMGASGVWVNIGVKQSESTICKIERWWYTKFLE